MKLFDAGIILILLTMYNNFLEGDCLNCWNNCGFYYEQEPNSSASTIGDCDYDMHVVTCNGSCSGDFQTTTLEKNYPEHPYLKAYIHMGCSPQTFSDSCVPTTSEKYEGVTQRCYCNEDTCRNFEHHGLFSLS